MSIFRRFSCNKVKCLLTNDGVMFISHELNKILKEFEDTDSPAIKGYIIQGSFETGL